MTYDEMRRIDAEQTERTDASVGDGTTGRRGFALPMAILIIAFLTVTIAAAYSSTSAELTTNNAQRGESRAYMIAQAGLENFMARRNEPGFCTQCETSNLPVTTYESTTVKLLSGRAYVVAQQVRTATDKRPAIYLLRSRGVDTTAKSISGSSIGTNGSGRAERTVAQLVYWNVNQVQVLSGWTSASGLYKKGSSGTISGVDNCNYNSTLNAGKMPTVAGIAVPNNDFEENANFQPTGNPPIQYLGTQEQTDASIKIDWSGMINNNRIQADYTFDGQADADAGWPSFTNTNFYPVIRVNGDFSLPDVGGRGTLIVLGNLTISGNNLWKGIIMVGGSMTSDGNNTMMGATMSGLNELFTPAGLDSARAISSSYLAEHPDKATANGTKTFQYDSCEVAKAANGLASYSVFPNAWMDNFVTY